MFESETLDSKKREKISTNNKNNRNDNSKTIVRVGTIITMTIQG